MNQADYHFLSDAPLRAFNARIAECCPDHMATATKAEQRWNCNRMCRTRDHGHLPGITARDCRIGGGRTVDGRHSHDDISAETGQSVVSVDYRLSPGPGCRRELRPPHRHPIRPRKWPLALRRRP